MSAAPRPTKQQLLAAAGRTLRDVVAPGLDVLFVGINPSLYSAAVGHHFARPGNRFWPVLHGAGFTDRVLAPFEDLSLIDYGIGITNLVARATAAAAELAVDEYVTGARVLERKLKRYAPRVVAFVGIGAFRAAYGRPRAQIGRQEMTIGPSGVWALPNTSGLNANHQLADLAREFGRLRAEIA